MHLSTRGHYCVDIIPSFTSNEPLEDLLILENTLESDAKFAQIKMILRQFEHASIENMQTLIGNAKLLMKDISLLIKKVVNTCETCITFCKSTPQLVAVSTKAEDFNETVSVDIHQLSTNLWYMHFVDECIRYSAAVIVRNKAVCNKAFVKNWISIFGAPKKDF